MNHRWLIPSHGTDKNVLPVVYPVANVLMLVGLKEYGALRALTKECYDQSDMYCQQLNKLNEAIAEKRSKLINHKEVVFHYDNARPHTSLLSREKLLKFGWDVLPYPPFLLNLVPSDYHLLRFLQNFLSEKRSL